MRAVRVTVALGLLGLATSLLSACPSSGSEVPGGQLRIATGSRGGVYFLYGGAIADTVKKHIPQLKPSVLETAASAENLRLVSTGGAEVGFAQADTSADYAPGGKVVALARLYDDYLHLVVGAKSGIGELAQLRGKRVSLGAPESGTIGTAKRLLSLEKIDPDKDFEQQQLGLDASAAALEEGRIDAFFFSGGLPVGRVAELAKKGTIAMVSIGTYAVGLRKAFGQFYAEHTVPASTYGLPSSVSTIGIANYLVVSASMPEETAYELIHVLFDEQDALERAHPAAARLNSRGAIYTDPLPLHPGAERYFKEIKP